MPLNHRFEVIYSLLTGEFLPYIFFQKNYSLKNDEKTTLFDMKCVRACPLQTLDWVKARVFMTQIFDLQTNTPNRLKLFFLAFGITLCKA